MVHSADSNTQLSVSFRLRRCILYIIEEKNQKLLLNLTPHHNFIGVDQEMKIFT